MGLGGRSVRAPNQLVALSVSDNWEDARREWEFTGDILYEGDEGFDPVCGICHQPNLTVIYRIRNIHTGRRVWVGSQCIRHYLILVGAQTLEDSRRLFEAQRRRAELVRLVLRPCAAAVLAGAADWPTVYRLHVAAQEYFGFRCAAGYQALPAHAWRTFVNQVVAGLPEGDELGAGDFILLRNCIINPRTMARPDRARLRNPSRREIVWGARRPRVATTLSRGVASVDPARLEDRVRKEIAEEGRPGRPGLARIHRG